MEQTSLSNFEIDKVMSGINVKYSQFKMDIDLKFKELFDNTIKDMKDFLSKYDDTILIKEKNKELQKAFAEIESLKEKLRNKNQTESNLLNEIKIIRKQYERLKYKGFLTQNKNNKSKAKQPSANNLGKNLSNNNLSNNTNKTTSSGNTYPNSNFASNENLKKGGNLLLNTSSENFNETKAIGRNNQSVPLFCQTTKKNDIKINKILLQPFSNSRSTHKKETTEFTKKGIFTASSASNSKSKTTKNQIKNLNNKIQSVSIDIFDENGYTNNFYKQQLYRLNGGSFQTRKNKHLVKTQPRFKIFSTFTKDKPCIIEENEMLSKSEIKDKNEHSSSKSKGKKRGHTIDKSFSDYLEKKNSKKIEQKIEQFIGQSKGQHKEKRKEDELTNHLGDEDVTEENFGIGFLDLYDEMNKEIESLENQENVILKLLNIKK